MNEHTRSGAERMADLDLVLVPDFIDIVTIEAIYWVFKKRINGCL